LADVADEGCNHFEYETAFNSSDDLDRVQKARQRGTGGLQPLGNPEIGFTL
jgi:hypothetical protein